MISKIDLRDFLEINRGLYGDGGSLAERGDLIRMLLNILDTKHHQSFAVDQRKGRD